MAILKQIKFGTGAPTPIAMTQVAINNDSQSVLKLAEEHIELNDANNPLYTIALAVDGKTILKGDTGLKTALTLAVKEAEAVGGEESKKARIALVDNGGAELSSVNIADIVGNGVITKTAYNPQTGELTITWAGGTTTVVDLGKLLDIDDVAIESASQNYLKVELNPAAGETGSQAVFGAKIVNVSEASNTKTGLVDAKDVKDYVDSKAKTLSVEAEGDEYINATVDSANNKKIKVSADVQYLTASAGTVGVYDANGKETTAPAKGSLSGTANSLVDGADVAEKVKTYVEGAVAIEAARADAKVLAAVKALDTTVGSTTVENEKHVAVQVVEEDGLLKSVTVTEYDIASKTALETETTARVTADTILTQNLEAEVTRATDAEQAIEAKVDKIKYNVDGTTLIVVGISQDETLKANKA